MMGSRRAGFIPLLVMTSPLFLACNVDPPHPATRVVIKTSPMNNEITTGKTFTVVAVFEDANNYPGDFPDLFNGLSVALTSSPKGATLSGTLSTTNLDDLSFSDLSVDLTGSYDLTFTAPPLIPATLQLTAAAPGSCASSPQTVCVPPSLTIVKTHTGNFTQGQRGAQYVATVSNAAGAGPTVGTVAVTEATPSGLSLAQMEGTGWSCAPGGATCTRDDPLEAGGSYPPITVTVDVDLGAPSPVVNQVFVAGGSSEPASDSDSTVISLSSPLIGVTVTPSAATAPLGRSVQFTASALRQDGTSFDVTAQATWSSSDASVTVSQGLAQGTVITAQPVTIRASYGGFQGTAKFTVAGPLVSIFVGPSTASVTVGNTIQFVATGTFSDGSERPITTSVTWSSSAPDVATVDNVNSGLATGLQVSAQPVTITATDPTTNVSGTAQLTVIAKSAGFVTLVSENAAGTGGGNQISQWPFAASMTGQYVAFRSGATDLVASPAVPLSAPVQVYVRNTCIGALGSCTPSTQMVSVDNSTPPNAGNDSSPSLGANISGDGSVVVFDSFATNLGPTAPLPSVFERQICGVGVGGCPSSTVLESLDDSGTALTSQTPVVSRDGRFVAFAAESDTGLPVSLRDTCLGAPSGCRPSTTLVSADNSGNATNGTGVPFAVSNGGRYVLFFDNGTNMPSGGTQLYIRDTCQQFGGRGGLPQCMPVTTTVSLGNVPPMPITDAGELPSMSDDGRYVEFVTANALVPNDLNGLPDVYIRDTCLQFGIGASFNPGAVANCVPTTTLVSVAHTGNATALPVFTRDFALDATGRFVVFGGGANDLVVTPPVPNGFLFGYARDTCLQYGTAPNFNPGAVPGCTPRTVLVTVDSTGTPIQLAGNLSISGDGRLVVFDFADPVTHIVQVAIGMTGF